MKKWRIISLLVLLAATVAVFAAGNVNPRTAGTETLGTTAKPWGGLTVTSITTTNADTISWATDDTLKFASNDTNSTAIVEGFEASDAYLHLDADQGDDNADTWILESEAADNDLSIVNHTTEVAKFTSAGVFHMLKGTRLAYVNKTANYTTASGDCVVSYNTAAATTNTLPEASTVLGEVFIICLQDDDGDLVVNTDGTDTFDGTNNKATMADAADSLAVMATAANVYTILVNVGATLGTQ